MLDVTVRVTGFENRGATVYKTDVHVDSHTWRVDIRYSIFREFYLKLHALYKDVDFGFPQKRGWLTSHPPQERQVQLDDFMQKTIRYYVRHGYPRTIQELLEQLLEVAEHVKKPREGRHSETMESNLSEEHVTSMSTINVVKEDEQEITEEPEEEMSESSQEGEVLEPLEQVELKPDSKKPVEEGKIEEDAANEGRQENQRQREESDASTADVQEEAAGVHSAKTSIQEKEFPEKVMMTPIHEEGTIQSAKLVNVTPDEEVKVQEIVMVSSSVSDKEADTSHHQILNEANEIDASAEKTEMNLSPIPVPVSDGEDKNAASTEPGVAEDVVDSAESAINEADVTSLSTSQDITTGQVDEESVKYIGKEIDQDAVVATVGDVEEKDEDKTSHATVEEEAVVAASAPVPEGGVSLNSVSTPGTNDEEAIVHAMNDNEMEVNTTVLDAKELEDVNNDAASALLSVAEELTAYVSGSVGNNIDPVAHLPEDGVPTDGREHEKAAHAAFGGPGEIASVPALNEEVEEDHEDPGIDRASKDENAAEDVPNIQEAVTLDVVVAVEVTTPAASMEKMDNLEAVFHSIPNVEQVEEAAETAASIYDSDEKSTAYEHSVVVQLIDEIVAAAAGQEEDDIALEVGKRAQSVGSLSSDEVNKAMTDEIASDQGNYNHGEIETIALKRTDKMAGVDSAEARHLSSVIAEAEQNDALVITDFSNVNDQRDHLEEKSANVSIDNSVHQEIAGASLLVSGPKDEERVAPAALNELSEKHQDPSARDTSFASANDEEATALSEPSTEMDANVIAPAPLFEEETTVTAAVHPDCRDAQVLKHPSVQCTGSICEHGAVEKAPETPSAVIAGEEAVAVDENEKEEAIIAPSTGLDAEETLLTHAVHAIDEECATPGVQVVDEDVDLLIQPQMKHKSSADMGSFATPKDGIVTAPTVTAQTGVEETDVGIQAVPMDDQVEASTRWKESGNHVSDWREETSAGFVAVAEAVEKKDVTGVCTVDSISADPAEEDRNVDIVPVSEKENDAKATAPSIIAVVADASISVGDDLSNEKVDASSPVAVGKKKLIGDRSPIAIVKSKLLGESNAKVYWVGLAVGVAAVGALAARKS